MYLHEVAPPELSFTKEDMHQGKHTEYERRLLEKLQSEKSTSQRDIEKGQPFELSEEERNMSPIMHDQGDNDDDKSDDAPSAHESGASEPETSFSVDQIYDYPPASAVQVHRESDTGHVEKPSVVHEERAAVPLTHSPAPFPMYEDDLGFDPLEESLKGLEELLQEEERHPLPKEHSSRE